MSIFYQQMKSYFKNTPKEQILKDWDLTEEYDNGIWIHCESVQVVYNFKE